MTNTKPPPPQRNKTSRIEGFGENVDLPLCVNKLHLYLSLLNMVSQKVVSQFDVLALPWKTGLWGRHMALELLHMRGTLL
jgi:hypothetical protein